MAAPAAGAIEDLTQAAKDAAKALGEARLGIADWLKGLMTDQNLSPLTPQQQLDFTHQAYVENLMNAQGGDMSALANYTKTAQDYLEQLKSVYGTASGQYMAGFAGVAQQAEGLAA